MERISVFKPTPDDWYPPYRLQGKHKGKPLQLVEVSFLQLIDVADAPPMWRVNVWGGDDFGMDKDHDHRDVAYELFQEVIRQPEVSQEFLREKGFTVF